MSRIVAVLTSVTLAAALLFLGSYLGGTDAIRKTKAQAVAARPNMVFILTDDMRKDDLRYMPKIRSLLGGRGMSFENAFVSNALCAPSRASIMRVAFKMVSTRIGPRPTGPLVAGGPLDSFPHTADL